ncbi:MAG: hypothetical protein WC756_03815 [Taibaiella sp.]|jgi:hypothetical protein
MATAEEIKADINTDIRLKTNPKSIPPPVVADKMDSLVDFSIQIGDETLEASKEFTTSQMNTVASGIGNAIFTSDPADADYNTYNLVGGAGVYTNFLSDVATPIELTSAQVPPTAKKAWQVYRTEPTGYWTLKEVPLDLSTYATKVELDRHNPLVPVTRYEHPRGVAEQNGNGTYDNATVWGWGVNTLMTQAGVINKIEVPFFGSADTECEVRIYRQSATNVLGTQLFAKVYAAGELNQNLSVKTVISVDIEVVVGVRIGAVIGWKAGHNPRMRYFSVDTTSPARDRVIKANTSSYPGLFAGSWSFGTGIYQAAMKMYFIPDAIQTVTDLVTGQVAGYVSAPDLEEALDDYDAVVEDVIFENPRGDSEVMGTHTYNDPNRGTGVYAQIAQSGTVTKVAVPFLGNATSQASFRIYTSAAYTNNTALMTLLYQKVYGTGEFPTNAAQLTEILLDTPIQVTAGNYIYIFVHDTAGTPAMAIRYFNANSVTTPFRTSFLRAPTSGNVWALAWGSSSLPTFSSGSFRLEYYKERVLKERLDDYLAESIAYTDAQLAEFVSEDPRIVLPSKIYAVVGKEFNLYYDALTLLPDYGSGLPPILFDVVCTKGLMDRRSFRFTPLVGDIGSYSLTFKVLNSFNQVVQQVTTSLVVVAAANPGSVKRILCIGDSTTDDTGEVTRVLQENLALIGGNVPLFLGTHQAAPYKNEARTGRTFAGYALGNTNYRFNFTGFPTSGYDLTNLRGIKYYHNTADNDVLLIQRWVVNPDGTGYVIGYPIEPFTVPVSFPTTLTKGFAPAGFPTTINVTSMDTLTNYSVLKNVGVNGEGTGALDISYYRQNVLGLGSTTYIDCVSIDLGINDINAGGLSAGAIAAIVTNADLLVAAFLADNAACKIVLCLPKSRSSDLMATTRKNALQRISIHDLRAALIAKFDNVSYPNVIISQSGYGMDRFYGYPTTDVQPAARITDITFVGANNDVHPAARGYAQVADAMTGAVLVALS